eukprot:15324780-Ditylum_brightwellii.AAC.1
MAFVIRSKASVLHMLDNSPQIWMHDHTIKYLEEHNIKINLSMPCHELVHELDENGLPTHITCIKVGPKEELKEFDADTPAVDIPDIKSCYQKPS